LIGGWFGGLLFHQFGEIMHRPGGIWLVLAAVGVLTAALLWIYDRVVRASQPQDRSTGPVTLIS
jgi:hypothetical protein